MTLRTPIYLSDIKDVAQVINFDLPKSVDEYVHRIGRTGRVGNRGLATSFFDPHQDSSLAPDLVRILSQAGQKIPDFLQQYANSSSYSRSTSSFGGRDIRVSFSEIIATVKLLPFSTNINFFFRDMVTMMIIVEGFYKWLICTKKKHGEHRDLFTYQRRTDFSA